MSKVIGLKLVSGEEVIGTVKESLVQDGSVTLIKPRVVAMMQSPDGRAGLGLVPWCHTNLDGTFTIKERDIMSEIDPMKPVVDAYTQETSAIQVAAAGAEKNIKLN